MSRLSSFRLAVATLGAVAGQARAEAGGGDKLTQTVQLQADYGLPVHRSDTVDSMAFGSAYRFGIGTFAGKGKAIALGLRYETSSTSYTQTDAQVDVAWTEFALGYRVWYLHPRVTVGSCAVTATLDGVDLVDAVGLTSGAGLGVRVPAGPLAMAFVETTYATVGEARDAQAQTVSLGPRIDLDLGVTIRLPWANIDVVPGYRYRTYAISRDGAGTAELETGPYVGLGVGFNP